MKRRNIVTVAVAGGIALLGGAAAAVALPGAASPTAGDHVPVTVPAPNAHAGSHPDGNAPDSTTTAASSTGSAVSQLATTTDATGVNKGAEISTLASGGQSQAGQQTGPDPTSDTAAPVTTPNTGGTGTADTASNGASTVGTSIANIASDGHSAAGSGNAAGGLSNKP